MQNYKNPKDFIMNFFKRALIKISVIFLTLLFSASAYSSSQLEVGDWDIDDDGRADALTDGLFFLRYTFGLRGDALISGLISSGSEYTTATDIERELALVYDASGDIDGDGNVDALTDGLLLLRYLFGLSGDTLTVGVVASNATRTTASELEGFISNLMPSAPYITLIGSAELAHEQATDYVDAGAIANDYADGTVEVSVSGSVDSDRAGVYVLTYTAVDSEGNEAKPVTRTVTVADTTPPVITLLGEATVEVDQNTSYTDAGATAVDAVDGVVDVVVTGSVDITTAGTYTLTYTATDSVGNIAEITRIVTVIKKTAIWINEFHYDNVGTDSNEFIEVMGVAGMDLEGYSLALYSGGQTGNYGNIPMQGVLADQSGSGFGTLAFDAVGLQNGSPDGFGLVSADGECIEFISYLGDMTASGGGACDGVFGEDIGVYEQNVSSDFSLQRTGSGRQAEHFTWVGPRLNSKGEINDGQSIGEPDDNEVPDNVGSLFGYTVSIGQVTTPDYQRPSTWDDSDNDCISDRHEILIAQHDSGDGEFELVMSSSGCSVISGRWYDPYDGVYYYNASSVEIDHVVALYESWISGLGNMSQSEQRIFANTGSTSAGTKPETSHQFLAVGNASNSPKGSKDPAQWMPNESNYHCTYLKKWVLVKVQNELLLDQAEFDYIASRQGECDDTALPELPENENQDNPETNLPDGPIGGSIWINEFHYDNDGVDQGEFVELAGPAGVDLTGWSLVLFNGFDDTAYNTIDLTGTLTDLDSSFGFLVIDFPTNGIQNGAPDGMALIDNNGECIELLSYEGRLSPNSGPCSEFLAIDIGVSEITTTSGGSTAVGSSLQRIGTGSIGPDFEWSGPSPNTKSLKNTGQVLQ